MSQLAELAARRCQPVRGEGGRLAPERVTGLLQLLPHWSLIDEGSAISRSFDFDDYYRTLAFVNALAYAAHAEDHHPDLGVHYNRCVVRYSTHDAGGLSDNDFICAARAELLHAQAR